MVEIAGNGRIADRRACTAACTVFALRLGDGILADHGHRRLFAAARRRARPARARRRRGCAGSALEQFAGAGQFAGDAVADAHGQGGRAVLAFAHDVEMVVEAWRPRRPRSAPCCSSWASAARCGVDRQRYLVLDQVQALDQQVAPARHVAQQRLHFGQGLRIEPPAGLGRLALAFTGGANGQDGNDDLVQDVSSKMVGDDSFWGCLDMAFMFS